MEEVAYQNAIADLARAGSSGERGEIVRRLADRLQITVQSVYRGLERRGWASGRRARSDRGRSALTEDALLEVAAMTSLGRNKRGMANLPAKEAHRLAQSAGLAAGDVSYGHLQRKLRTAGLSLAHINAPQFAVARVSKHPNQVHFFDISVAIQWYFRDASGRKLELYDDAGARFYEGKAENFRRLQKTIHRFLLVDHYSGARYFRYYYSTGERAEDVVDFLWRAWSPKPFGAAWPFRGLPNLLVMDQGSANKSALVRELLSGLDVEPQLHATGNAKASGAVESGGHLWTQRSFEGWLTQANKTRDGERFAPNLETLNQWAEEFCAVRCAEVPHTRHGRAPLALWATITADQLREAPRRDVFFALAVSAPEERTVNSWRCIEVDRVRYQLTGGTTLRVGAKVKYRLAPWSVAGLRAWDETGSELAVERIEIDAVSGFPLGGDRHVFESDADGEKGATTPRSAGQQLVDDLKDGTRAAPQLDTWGALHRKLDGQAFDAPEGRPWQAPAAALPVAVAPLLTELDVLVGVRDRLGRRLGPAEHAHWSAIAADGLTADAMEQAWSAFVAGGTHLREVG